MKKKQTHTRPSMPKTPRSHRVSFLLNDEEWNAVNHHLEKYKIQNRSRWVRETMFSHILEVMENDYPTLFSENEMRG